MRFSCNNCNRELNIPDDKLPSADKFKVRCPQCKTELILDKSKAITGARPGEVPVEREIGYAGRSDVDSTTMEPEIFPPGAKIVFSMIKNERWMEAISSFFQEMGYYESTADNMEVATLKVRLNDYTAIFLQDDRESMQVLEEIGTWNGLRRRACNIVMLGDRGASLDSKIGFELGVNFYLNVNDLANANELFHDILRGYSDYYRWLYSAMELEIGTPASE